MNLGHLFYKFPQTLKKRFLKTILCLLFIQHKNRWFPEVDSLFVFHRIVFVLELNRAAHNESCHF